jgi:tetratricopeptide (TPR) repeat protein
LRQSVSLGGKLGPKSARLLRGTEVALLACMRFIVFTALTLLPSLALADARRDIVELRHGRTRSHQTFFGWTEDGQAVARRLVCSEGGEMTCRATIDVLEPGEDDHTTLLWENTESLYEVATPEDPKGPISLAEATAFIRAEAKALRTWDRLVPGAVVSPPAEAFGTIGGEPTWIYLRTSNHPTEEDALRLHVAVRGPRGVSIDLEQIDNEPWRLEGFDLLDARVSADGSSVFVAMHYMDGVMCWDGEDIELTVADRRAVRAKIANAVGLRAYRAGELDEARARFHDATVENPEYAWGWFNQAALQSRRAEVEESVRSLGRAIDLDERLRERACKDDDFTAVADTEPGRALLRC